MPKYSIVMPVYGVEDFLCNAIQSVLNQTILDYELILVDDESPDNCPQICDDYASKYSQIKVVHHYCPVKILDLEINRVDHHPLGR